MVIFSRFPFDWKTPSGYLASVFIQSSCTFFSSELYLITLIIIIGLCSFVTDFVSDLEQDLRDLNSDLIGIKNGIFPTADRIKIKTKLIDVIKFHSEAIE